VHVQVCWRVCTVMLVSCVTLHTTRQHTPGRSASHALLLLSLLVKRRCALCSCVRTL
jgi:hypothetical protein